MDSREVNDAGHSQRRLFIDISHTAGSGLNTGIQRVVRKLVQFLPQESHAENTECFVVLFRDGCFQYADQEPSWYLLDYRSLRAQFANRLPKWYQRLAGRLCQSGPTAGLRRWLLPAPGSLGLCYLPAKIWCIGSAPLRRLALGGRKVRFKPGDQLLLPDGYWAFSQIWPAVADAKRSGASVALVVYDVICIQHPEFFVSGAKEKFEDYLRNVFQYADRIVAISKTVESQVESLLDEYSTPRGDRPELSHFRLGADISARTGGVRPALTGLFENANRGYYLVVSTLEPRKNHVTVVDAFDELWERTEVGLILVGRRGWMCEQLVERLIHHPEFGKRLHWFDDLSDAELSYCYEKSVGVICPSLAEGFGLPIVESLWHHKRTLASDIAIHREVGGVACHYFPKQDARQLAILIERLTSIKEQSDETQAPDILDWQSSARQLLQVLSDISGMLPASNPTSKHASE